MIASRPVVSLLAVLVTALIAPASGQAGSLGDFGNDFRDKRSERNDDDNDDSDDHGWDNGWDDDDHASGSSLEGEDVGACGLLMAYILLGYVPGYGFSFGRTPYQGRGHLTRVPESFGHTSSEVYDRRYQFDDDEVDAARYTLLQFRAEGLVTPTGDAVGWGAFAKLSSTFTPALVVWQMEAYERATPERLGFGQALIEPRLLMNKTATLSWNAGVNWLYDEEEFLGTGPSVGLALEVNPVRPLHLEARINGHFPALVPVFDLSLGLGAYLASPLALQATWRRLAIRQGATVDFFGASLSYDLTF